MLAYPNRNYQEDNEEIRQWKVEDKNVGNSEFGHHMGHHKESQSISWKSKMANVPNTFRQFQCDGQDKG